MKCRSIEQLGEAATVCPAPVMCASERLARWAALLDEFDSYVRLFEQIEYKPVTLQRASREDRSPVSIALRDPVLRLQGLGGETYGDAMRFFGISERRMHRIVCNCHYFHRRIVPSRDVAGQVRVAEARARRIEKVLSFLGLNPARANRLVAAMV